MTALGQLTESGAGTVASTPQTIVEDAIHAWIVAATGLAPDKVLWGQQGMEEATGPWISLRLFATNRIGQDWADHTSNPLAFGPALVESVDAAANTLTLTAHGLQTGDGPVRVLTTDTAPGGLASGTDYWAIRVDASTLKLASSFTNALAGTAIDLTSTGTGTHNLNGTSSTVRAGAEVLYYLRGTRTARLSIQCFAGAAIGTSTPLALLERCILTIASPKRRAAFVAAGLGIGTVGSIQPIDGVKGQVYFEPRAVVDVNLHLASEITETGTFIQAVAGMQGTARTTAGGDARVIVQTIATDGTSSSETTDGSFSEGTLTASQSGNERSFSWTATVASTLVGARYQVSVAIPVGMVDNTYVIAGFQLRDAAPGDTTHPDATFPSSGRAANLFIVETDTPIRAGSVYDVLLRDR